MRKCLYCKKGITGRVDKIFCEKYCKSAYHYQAKKDEDPSDFKKIDNQIKLNRRLLLHFNQAGKATIRKEKLIEAGFNPKFFTHTWANKKGQVYYFCYDVGFLELEENNKVKYVLVHYQAQYMGAL